MNHIGTNFDDFLKEEGIIMNDRFKFRVWNKARQCFIPEKEIFICGNGELVLIDEALNRTWVKDNPNYAVSLCTGLKDKNDKLIYEGDIVKDDHEALHFVKWCYNAFKLEPLFKNCYTIGIVDDEIEVIGNIYENKELLNDR